MTFTGDEDHSINLDDASKLTANYRKNAGSGAKLGGFFGGTSIKNLLSQPDVVGLRYYYGEKDDGTPVLVLCGVKADGNDVYKGELMEAAIPCPPGCSTPNPLNS